MSYTIEYDRQFIKSDLGITPLWLAGSSNVWEIGFNGRERRERSWSVFLNKAVTSEEELLEAVKPMMDGYQEHWRKGGKWLDDNAVVRWIKSGCKNAATIEDILSVNNLRSVNCHLIEWDGDKRTTTHQSYITKTDELNSWLQDITSYMNSPEAKKKSVYPYIGFYNEPIKHPTSKKASRDPHELVLLKSGNMYVFDVNEKGYKMHRNIHNAQIFTYEKAVELLNSTPIDSLRNVRIVSAATEAKPRNIAIAFSNGYYLYKKTRRGIRLCLTPSAAFRYVDEAAAKRAMNNHTINDYCEQMKCTVSAMSV